MKFAKTAFLLALAAMAAMSFVASAASANSTPCTNDAAHQGETACAGSHGKHLKVGSEIVASLKAGTVAKLTITSTAGASVKSLECTTSTVRGNITSTTGAGTISSLTFSNCSLAGCEDVTAFTPRTGKAFPWAATATTGTAPNGTLAVSNVSGAFTAKCPAIFIPHVECEYEAASATVAITGGTPASVVATSVPLTRVFNTSSELICGATANWTATYTVSTPSSLFLT